MPKHKLSTKNVSISAMHTKEHSLAARTLKNHGWSKGNNQAQNNMSTTCGGGSNKREGVEQAHSAMPKHKPSTKNVSI
jgi:hypothetical protein